MTISKDKIEISTIKTVVAIVVFTSGILAVFYNSLANASSVSNGISERVTSLEAVVPGDEKWRDSVDKRFDSTDRKLENLAGLLQTYLSQSKNVQ